MNDQMKTEMNTDSWTPSKQPSSVAWDDAEMDAIRALLEEDEPVSRRNSRSMQPEAFPAAPAPRPQEPRRAAAPDMRMQPGQSVPAPMDRKQEKELRKQEKALRKQQNRKGKKPSAAAIVILYVIILTELAAIGAVGYQWYLWMK